jgi:hypothetical protein
MLSDDAKTVLKYFWTITTEDDPAFMLKAVDAGVHPEKFVDACITTLEDLSPQANIVRQNMLENKAEAAQVVAGILGFM